MTNEFKPQSEILRILTEHGITPDKNVFTYWQGGIRAANSLFVMQLVGYNNTQNYDGSMGEWANLEDTPLE